MFFFFFLEPMAVLRLMQRMWQSTHLPFLSLQRILQFPRPVKLDDLHFKAKVAFGQAMDLHYTNNEVVPLFSCMGIFTAWSRLLLLLLFLKNQCMTFSWCSRVSLPGLPWVAGHPIVHTRWLGEGGGVAGSQCTHEEPEDLAGSALLLTGQSLATPLTCSIVFTLYLLIFESVWFPGIFLLICTIRFHLPLSCYYFIFFRIKHNDMKESKWWCKREWTRLR